MRILMGCPKTLYITCTRSGRCVLQQMPIIEIYSYSQHKICIIRRSPKKVYLKSERRHLHCNKTPSKQILHDTAVTARTEISRFF